MSRRGPQAVLFDLDGTLVDSAGAVCSIANVLMSELGLRPLDLAETRSYIGNGAGVFLERALSARSAFDRDSIGVRLDRFHQLYEAAPGADNPPFAGVGETLEVLHASGHRLALCTNKPAKPTRVLLDAHGWHRFIGTVIAGDTLPQRKPHPAPLIEALRRSGGGAAVYVGDSEVDAETARAAGVAFLIFTEGYRKAGLSEIAHDASFDNFADLPPLIVRHARRPFPVSSGARD